MPGTLDDSNCASPTPTTTSSTGADGLHDSRHDYNGRSWSRHSRSSSALDRHSESSESLDNHSTSSGTGGRPMHDFGSSEYIPTRSSKVSPRVAYNPMQFVKTGPPKLVNTAYEQLRKAEEVKKVREVRKDDAEDWQSNLEGWKSSRRKRQEHVIERVTEVKRMEQEEALKASEAAAKRLMGIREKRGKLSALYSVEDDNEIAFDVPADSATTTTTTSETKTMESAVTTTSTKDDEVFQVEKRETMKASTTTTATTTMAAAATTARTTALSSVEEESKSRDSQEYTYDKAIEQYVKYSTTALSKQETTSTQEVAVVVADPKPTIESAPVKPSGSSEEVVKKRAAIFERELSNEQDDANGSRASALAAANRRSGEFSSTFKSRLSTFESVESSTSTLTSSCSSTVSGSAQPAVAPAAATVAAAAAATATTKVTPDPQFRTKLATFHRSASSTSTTDEVKKAPVVVTADEEEKPDFKARLAAFRQVEETMRATCEPAKPAPKPKPAALRQEPPKPVPVPVAKQQPEPVNNATQQPQAREIPEPEQPVDEPIYANSSVALSQAFPDADQSAAESSDCTEDEGIRSLSPHGTPSPTSPTRTDADPMAQQSNAFVSFHAFQPPLPPLPSPPSELPPPPAINSEEPNPIGWSQSEVVWDDWVDSGSVAAPPTEKPPPPPLDEDAPVTKFPTTSTATPVAPSPVDCASPAFAHHQVMTRNGREADSDVRKELRKRRSDFLGFDVNAMENDAQELADAIPPPPDLKTLLQSTSDYRTSETIGSSSWQTQAQPKEPVQAKVDDEELARKEREIIETLEKEERMKAASSPYSAHNTSNDGVEFEMNAEIDQLAREWRNDAVLGPSWRAPSKLQAFQAPPADEAKQAKPVAAVQQPLQVEINSPRQPGGTLSPTSPRPPQPSPPKPSRLSAAPKPRLHDGEAWMAKRKVASEANQKKDMKDVSRHWLIQEAEQRRIDAMQERNYSPSSSSSIQMSSPVRPGPASSGSVSIDGNAWMSRSSSSTSVDKMSELRLPKDQSRSTSSLGSSPISRPLYANQEEILEYADFTGAPHAAPPVWQVRSIVSSSSMDQLSSIHTIQPPVRPAKMTQSKSQTLPPASSLANPAQTQPSWRSTHPPETEKEPIPPLPHSVIHTLTQRVSQRTSSSNMNNNNNNNNYGDYMNVQEASGPTFSRAGPQVPPQRPTNYRHPSLAQTPSAPAQMTNSGVQPPILPPNNNDRMLSVSGKKKCSLCQEELGRGAAMIIESLRLFYHINCFRCCVCGIALGNGTAGTDVRVRNNNLHCHDCYSNDDGLKFSKV